MIRAGTSWFPFGTEEDLERAVESCRCGQVRSKRRKEKKRAAVAAVSESVSQGEEVREIKEASGEPVAVATTEASIPEFSGAAEVEAAIGGSPKSPPPKPPARTLNYELEDISDTKDEPGVLLRYHFWNVTCWGEHCRCMRAQWPT